jgi:predicted enzyme related to lactoylglutathione lyase
MGRIIHVELTTDDLHGTSDFFSHAFGWQLTPSEFVEDYLTADTGAGGGIDGALMTVPHQKQPVIVWIEVQDIHETIRDVVKAGGTADGDVHELHGEGLVTYITDPAGLVFGVKQPAATDTML